LRGVAFSWALGLWLATGAFAHGAAAEVSDRDGATPAVGEARRVAAKGLAYRGLRWARSGRCEGSFEVQAPVAGRIICTHGPDPLSLGARAGRPARLSAAGDETGEPRVRCVGDGASGARIELIYAHAEDVPSRYAEVVPRLQGIAAEISRQIEESAAETGGFRTPRFLTSSNCTPVVREVTLSPSGDDTFYLSQFELSQMGFDRGDRRYLVFMDANALCGIANVMGPLARVDFRCWDSHSALHELTHALGAVAPDAPNHSSGSHCTDDLDVMCYVDGPSVVVRTVCPSLLDEALLDCNHDDYFSTAPPAGSFLSLNPDWNAAESSFLAEADGESPTFLLPRGPSYEGPSYEVRAFNADDDLCVYGEGAGTPRVRLFCVARGGERRAEVGTALRALAPGAETARLRLIATDRGGLTSFGFTVFRDGAEIFSEAGGELGVSSSGRPLGALDPSTRFPVFYNHTLTLALDYPQPVPPGPSPPPPGPPPPSPPPEPPPPPPPPSPTCVAAESTLAAAEAELGKREAGRRVAAGRLRDSLRLGRRLGWTRAASRGYASAARRYRRAGSSAAAAREEAGAAREEKLTACGR